MYVDSVRYISKNVPHIVSKNQDHIKLPDTHEDLLAWNISKLNSCEYILYVACEVIHLINASIIVDVV